MSDTYEPTYKERRRSITATVRISEHEAFALLAARAGLPTTTYATQVLREHLTAQHKEGAHAGIAVE